MSELEEIIYSINGEHSLANNSEFDIRQKSINSKLNETIKLLVSLIGITCEWNLYRFRSFIMMIDYD